MTKIAKIRVVYGFGLDEKTPEYLDNTRHAISLAPGSIVFLPDGPVLRILVAEHPFHPETNLPYSTVYTLQWEGTSREVDAATNPPLKEFLSFVKDPLIVHKEAKKLIQYYEDHVVASIPPPPVSPTPVPTPPAPASPVAASLAPASPPAALVEDVKTKMTELKEWLTINIDEVAKKTTNKTELDQLKDAIDRFEAVNTKDDIQKWNTDNQSTITAVLDLLPSWRALTNPLVDELIDRLEELYKLLNSIRGGGACRTRRRISSRKQRTRKRSTRRNRSRRRV